MDVTSFSDEELASMLAERGFTPGPIVDSTRRVYQKKLQRMLESDVYAEGSYTTAPFDDHQYSEVDDDEDDNQLADTQPISEVIESHSSQSRSSPRRAPREEAYRYRQETSTITSSAGDTSVLTRRALRQSTNANDYVTQATPPPQEKKGGLSICAQIVIFVVVALLIFLVIQNMEPAAKDPLAGIGND